MKGFFGRIGSALFTNQTSSTNTTEVQRLNEVLLISLNEDPELKE